MKKIYFLSLIALATGFSCSCSTAVDENPSPIEEGSIVLKAGMEIKVEQDNAFALDLLKKTIAITGDSKVFVSPLSVSIAFGMAWNGAVGATRTEMEQALGMSGMSADVINDYYKIMQTSLPVIDTSTTLNLANSIWYRTGFPIKDAFLDVNANYFNAEIRALDFSKAWALDTINNWCSRKTNGMIPSALDRITEDAKMYLINAVYFKGSWTRKFDKEDTYETNFTNEQGNQVKVNMMNQTDTFAYKEDAFAQYVDIPYGNGAFSMTVILPSGSKSTTEVLNYLTPDKWNNMLQSLTERKVHVAFPRFKTDCSFLLNEELKEMGMNLAFTDQADFSKISDTALCISRVIHKTAIEVTEEGTEAAAVTIIEFVTTSMPDYPSVDVNKPFLFVIREKSAGIILFAGKMGSIEKF